MTIVDGRAAGATASHGGPLLLVRHAVLQPRPGEEVAGVLRSRRGAPEGSETLLTLRHMALQALELRAAQLMQDHSLPHGLAAELFLDGGFEHVYLDGPGFAAAAAEAGQPPVRPLLFDELRRWLVIDCARCYRPGSAQFTPAAIEGLVALTASPRLVAALQARLQRVGRLDLLPRGADLLRDAAGLVTRYVLCEPGLELGPIAQSLARQAGARRVARACLAGATDDVHATVDAFEVLLSGVAARAEPA